MVGAAALLWAGWVASTLAGALGAALVDPRRLGLDALFPAILLGLLLRR